MKPTGWRVLLALAVIGAAVGWAVVSVVQSWSGSTPSVPWTAPLTMAALAGGFAVAARALRPRLRREEGHKPLDPFVAARTAVLAMAGSRAGAFLAGGYAGFGVELLPDLDNTYRRSLLLPIGCSLLAALALMLAALWLEHVCRIPSDHDDPTPGRAA